VFAGRAGLHVVWIGGLMGVGSLGVGYWHWLEDLACWQTELFTTLAFAQVGQALAAQSSVDSAFRSGLFANRLLASMAGLAVALQLAVVYLGPLQRVFGTDALSASDLATTVVVGAAVFTAMELEKWLRRSSRQRLSSQRALESTAGADA
jgi:P-type Ca2+ transporter type 2C